MEVREEHVLINERNAFSTARVSAQLIPSSSQPSKELELRDSRLRQDLQYQATYHTTSESTLSDFHAQLSASRIFTTLHVHPSVEERHVD